jgi:hypothetical protein
LRRGDERRNEQSRRLTALLAFWLAAVTSLLLMSQPHAGAASAVAIGARRMGQNKGSGEKLVFSGGKSLMPDY